MAIFETYLSPTSIAKLANGEEPQLDRLDRIKFIKNEKSVFALILPAIWLLVNRLWIEFGIYACVMAALTIFTTTDIGKAFALLTIFPGLYLFLEGNNLIASKLEREDWQMVSVIEAKNREDAQLRFLTRMIEEPHSIHYVKPSAPSINPTPKIWPKSKAPEIGIFSEG